MRGRWGSNAGGAVSAAVVFLAGCGVGGQPRAPADAAPAVAPMPAAVREQLLDGAVAVLERLDDFDESAAYAQVFDRLNQWGHGAPVAGGAWRRDELCDSLPESLAALATPERLASSVFDAATDVIAVRDQRWLASIAAEARGSAVDDLAIAENLFRWTVRSLAVVGDPPAVPTEDSPGARWMIPGEILLSGRASPAQRAWIFLELLRQVGIDGVMLATGDSTPGPARGSTRGPQRPWIPAVITGGEAYLFEPTYGMPIPGPGGRGIATARQAATDETILAGLSTDDRPYPVQAGDIAGLGVLVAGDPWSLSRRMALVDRGLSAAHGMRVSVDASAVAKRARDALPGGPSAAAALWAFPWETLLRRQSSEGAVRAAVTRELAPLTLAFRQPAADGRGGGRVVRPLFVARVKEFRGDVDGADGAKAAYLAARPSKQAIAAAVRGVPPQQADAVKRVYEQMKEDATYWLGILTLAEGEYETAIDYLQRMTLEATPDGRWTDAARTNLARAFIAVGRIPEAAALLREDPSPQRFGSRVLARQIEAAAATERSSAAPPKP
jgi:hypothetical protein